MPYYCSSRFCPCCHGCHWVYQQQVPKRLMWIWRLSSRPSARKSLHSMSCKEFWCGLCSYTKCGSLVFFRADGLFVYKSLNLHKGVHQLLFGTVIFLMLCNDKVSASSDFIQYGGAIDPTMQGDANRQKYFCTYTGFHIYRFVCIFTAIVELIAHYIDGL